MNFVIGQRAFDKLVKSTWQNSQIVNSNVDFTMWQSQLGNMKSELAKMLEQMVATMNWIQGLATSHEILHVVLSCNKKKFARVTLIINPRPRRS